MTDIEYLKKYYKGNIEDAIKRLNNGEPVQYIVGNVDFYNSNFIVNKNVLIPRFETEGLVEKTIKLIQEKELNNSQVLEIGTGSGCISIALKKEIDTLHITSIDISKKALRVAKMNANENEENVPCM